MSHQQKATILKSHIFLMKKRTGEIKGRTAVGGNKQQMYIEKEDANAPTVATESTIIMSLVDAIEHRHTAVIKLGPARTWRGTFLPLAQVTRARMGTC